MYLSEYTVCEEEREVLCVWPKLESRLVSARDREVDSDRCGEPNKREEEGGGEGEAFASGEGSEVNDVSSKAAAAAAAEGDPFSPDSFSCARSDSPPVICSSRCFVLRSRLELFVVCDVSDLLFRLFGDCDFLSRLAYSAFIVHFQPTREMCLRMCSPLCMCNVQRASNAEAKEDWRRSGEE